MDVWVNGSFAWNSQETTYLINIIELFKNMKVVLLARKSGFHQNVVQLRHEDMNIKKENFSQGKFSVYGVPILLEGAKILALTRDGYFRYFLSRGSAEK